MTPFAWFVIGGLFATVVWAFVIAWLLDVVAAQRKQINGQLTTLRLYRETRTDSDRQVRALLDQNERLAVQLIELSAKTTPGVIAVPARFFAAEAKES